MIRRYGIGFLILALAMPPSCVVLNNGFNYVTGHNEVTRTRDETELSKSDLSLSIFGRRKTVIKINEKEINITRGDFEKYTDRDRDGLVDRFRATYKDENGAEFIASDFERKNDYEEFKWAFDRADKEYQEQLKRFQPLLEKHKLWPVLTTQR